MADRKISDLTALTAPAAGDYLPIVDISEASAANKNKRITIEKLLRGAPDGTAAAPSIGFESDPNTGIYRSGADQLAISTNGVGRLFVGSTGQIGISQSSLTTGGFTGGTLRIGHATGQTAGVLLQNTSTATDSSFWYTDGTDSYLGSNNGFFAHFAGGTERARIDSSGRLLVGTSTARGNFLAGGASARVQVENAGEGTAELSAVRNVSSNSGGLLILGKSRSSAVGAVTTVINGDQMGWISFQGADGTNLVEGASIRGEVDGTPGANDMPGRLVFSTTADGASSPTERMRIGNGGATGLYCDVTNDTLYVSSAATAGTTRYLLIGKYSASGPITSGTNSLLVFTNGNIQNTNNSYGAISDIKLKENIVDANSQWDDIKAIKVRKYNFKEGQTHTQIGLIAQEVELVSPGLVSESPDRDAEGNDLGTVTKSVNYSVLYMKAVKALQEAMERIETLEASNADLLARVSALESA